VTDLVVVSLEAWDDVWRRHQHLVSRLLAADPALRVLFVEPAADPLHAARRGARVRRGRGLRRGELTGAEGRLWLYQPTKWLPRRVDPRADARVSASIVRAARQAGLHDPVLWLNDPLSADLLRRTGWPALYDVTDDWLLADRPPREHDRLVEGEEYLLAHCRHVVVCSSRLLETKRAERVTLVQNAVDLDAYQGDLPRPADLPPGKVVLYVGTLHRDRLDVELSAELARSLAGTATLTFVGPLALDTSDQERLSASGAVLLGAREHATIPAYLTNADVLVVPHVVSEFTESLDPIKVYEYLAAGRPVVSTPVAGFRELDDDLVVSVGRNLVATRVAEALTGRRERTRPANVGTWEDRARAMREVVADLRSGPSPS
jgi:glycosyltransferase involved in cell wall biosynthesis